MKVTGDITTITSEDAALTVDVLRVVARSYKNPDAPEPTIMRAAANLVQSRLVQARSS